MPAGMARSVELLRRFRREQSDPDGFYSYLAADTVRLLDRFTTLGGAVAVDVGGGAGYAADALRSAGARCLIVELEHEELTNFGRTPERAVRGDGYQLPIATASVDLYHSSNVLEHVPAPGPMLDEMVRVLRPGSGVAFVSFTNWLSPWGGHETSPWHYVGGDRARRRYERRYGHPPKNRFGTTMFAVSIGDVLRWLDGCTEVEVLWAGPRYLPEWMRWVVRVPGVRELATWNLALVLRRRQ
jgi:SAM-dependent methyltransferase